MKYFKILVFIIIGSFSLSSFNTNTAYKCLIQMKNYSGEGVYVVISVLDEADNYVETLHVRGEDEEWYHDIDQWWDFYGKTRPSLDGKTGATIAGGRRAVTQFQLQPEWINKGYSLRFETAVEDQAYHLDDVKVKITSQLLEGKTTNGKGFIRFIKLLPL